MFAPLTSKPKGSAAVANTLPRAASKSANRPTSTKGERDDARRSETDFNKISGVPSTSSVEPTSGVAQQPNHVPKHALQAIQTGGEPPPMSFASGLSFHFADVRIHADENAARSADQLHARAFTLGQHVVLGRGERGNRRLLRHELAHVVQQSAPRGATHTSYEQAEQEAERAASSMQGFLIGGRRPWGLALAPKPPDSSFPDGPSTLGSEKSQRPQQSYTEGVDPEQGISYKRATGELGVPGEVKSARSNYNQSKVSGGTGDDAGHLIAALFGGVSDARNLSLQNYKANEFGTWKKLENSFSRKLRSGVSITVDIRDETRIGENRPFHRHIDWTETTPDGEIPHNSLSFVNTHTEESRRMQNVPPTDPAVTDNPVAHVNFVKKARATTPEEIEEAGRPLPKRETARPPVATPKSPAPRLLNTVPLQGEAANDNGRRPGRRVPLLNVAAANDNAAPSSASPRTAQLKTPEVDVTHPASPAPKAPTHVEAPEVSSPTASSRFRGIGVQYGLEAGTVVLGFLEAYIKAYYESKEIRREIQEKWPKAQQEITAMLPLIDALRRAPGTDTVYALIDVSVSRTRSFMPSGMQESMAVVEDVKVTGMSVTEKTDSHDVRSGDAVQDLFGHQTVLTFSVPVWSRAEEKKQKLARERAELTDRLVRQMEKAKEKQPPKSQSDESHTPFLPPHGVPRPEAVFQPLPGAPDRSNDPLQYVAAAREEMQQILFSAAKLTSDSPRDQIQEFGTREDHWRLRATYLLITFKENGPDLARAAMEEILNAPGQGGELKEYRNRFGL